MQSKTLLAFVLLVFSIMIAPITAFATQGNGNGNEDDQGEDNQNGNGGQTPDVQSDTVQVSVQRGENKTEEINVTPNITVVVDFEETKVTNESVTIGAVPETPQGNQSTTNQTQNATVPTEPTQPPTENETGQGNATEGIPENCLTPPCPPSQPQENQTVPTEPIPFPPQNETTTPPIDTTPGNETGTMPPTGNQTVDQNQTAPPVILPPDIGQNETTGVEQNNTAPPVTPTTPVNETQEGNVTVPTEPTIPPANTTIPTDNGTVIVEPPKDQPTAINLALVENIQRGHIQHVTAYVTDDKGNEFVDETVTIKVVNAKGKTIQDEVVASGQTFHFKVGPNTSPQSINVYATLDSDPSVAGQGSYDVYPKPRPIIELPPQPMPFAQ